MSDEIRRINVGMPEKDTSHLRFAFGAFVVENGDEQFSRSVEVQFSMQPLANEPPIPLKLILSETTDGVRRVISELSREPGEPTQSWASRSMAMLEEAGLERFTANIIRNNRVHPLVPVFIDRGISFMTPQFDQTSFCIASGGLYGEDQDGNFLTATVLPPGPGGLVSTAEGDMVAVANWQTVQEVLAEKGVSFDVAMKDPAPEPTGPRI